MSAEHAKLCLSIYAECSLSSAKIVQMSAGHAKPRLGIYAECSLFSAKIRNKTIATSVLPLFLFFFRIIMVCMILHTCHALPAAHHQHMMAARGNIARYFHII